MVRQPNTGPGGARNVGSVIARGKLIAFIDADDRWRPEKLAKQVALHDRRPELVLTATDFIHFDEHGLIDEFTVMLRPLSAVQAVGEAMLAAIAQSKDELGVEA